MSLPPRARAFVVKMSVGEQEKFLLFPSSVLFVALYFCIFMTGEINFCGKKMKIQII